MNQITWFEEEQTLEARYQNWKSQNPHITRQFYSQFNRLANHWVKTEKRFGSKMVAEYLRYNGHFTSNESDYKIDNSFVSRLGRDWQAAKPDLAGAMRNRELRS